MMNNHLIFLKCNNQNYKYRYNMSITRIVSNSRIRFKFQESQCYLMALGELLAKEQFPCVGATMTPETKLLASKNQSNAWTYDDGKAFS